MFDYLYAMALSWPAAAVSLLLALVVGGLLWVTHNALTHFDDREVLFEQGSVAYLVQRVALVLAFGIAALPTITRGDGDHPWNTLPLQAAQLAWVFVALLGARYLVDAVLLRERNTEELLAGNTALGVLEAGFYLGFGFVLNGSLTGSAETFGLSLASTVVFGLLGLAVVVGVFWLHEAVTPWSVRQLVRDRSLTAAFEAGGLLTAVGIVVREGVAGDFTGWTDGLVAFAATTLFAVVMLYLFRWVTNRLILRSWTLRQIQEQQRTTASAFSAVLLVVVAISVAAVVRTQL
ncbi:protein of unknown function [Microlunatus sagamiharensis]|uniref:DUF350 domain-containing protein n=1 Tax=Microlunatus sagamiharensis TaxID=546874 RepID=A0A1H2LHU4_9ACTN|nr:DUF350 domain-containing protein [Microlunatus sagamiharensis]SDU79956.1 protein of unknown function [Microlunatus sagamiharensis]